MQINLVVANVTLIMKCSIAKLFEFTKLLFIGELFDEIRMFLLILIKDLMELEEI